MGKSVAHLPYSYSELINECGLHENTLLGLLKPLIKFQSGNEIVDFKHFALRPPAPL